MDASTMNAHWHPQSHLLDQFRVDQFVRLEELDEGMRAISERLGLSMPGDHLERRQANPYATSRPETREYCGNLSNIKLMEIKAATGVFPDNWAFLHDQSIRQEIAKVYRRDFEMLPYELSDAT
jgi:hypothetical protein